MEHSKILNRIPHKGKHLEEGIAWSTGISNEHSNRDDKNKKRKKINTVKYGVHNFYSSSLSLGTTSSVVAGNNENREYLLIQNVGTQVAYLGFSVPASVSGVSSIELNPGFQIEFNTIVPNNVINGACPTNTTLIVLEGRGE